jgi:protoporphyrinogen oxidase
MTAESANVHYVTDYRYPTRGGYQSYLQPFLDNSDLRSNHRVVKVSPKEQSIHFAAGEVVEYDHVVSTIPLTTLVELIADVPEEVSEAAQKLAATDMILVNVGIDREDVGDTWTYFYDQDVVFTRVSYPTRLSPYMAPEGCGSFQCEIYFSQKYRPLAGTPEDYIEPAISDLKKTGLIRDRDRILHRSALYVPFGNIIHDHDRIPALRIVHSYFDEIGIRLAGRYGLWGYQWTDEAFISGEQAAQSIIDAI